MRVHRHGPSLTNFHPYLMNIDSVTLTGFRNFADAQIRFAEKTLLIGANDVGKTNLLHALRLLLDRTLSEADLEPKESDFHIGLDGSAAESLWIIIKFTGVTQDAVLSRLKGYVSDAGETFLSYYAKRSDLSYTLLAGHTAADSTEIDGRFYLKHLHFKYVESCRDIAQYIHREKKFLLKTAKERRTAEQKALDEAGEVALQGKLGEVNDGINALNYVQGATSSINFELKELSNHHIAYEVGLQTRALDFTSFVERLQLGATSAGRKVGLGGDGRNNQILVGLWKAKSEMEHDHESEVIIYCIEEPEAHLHPHQQRKLADYLVTQLKGQVLVSTHSPQITSEFGPGDIIRLYEKNGHTVAASGGCSPELADACHSLGYRMSVLPAEAFFADAVLLVEGPSEILFYHELARQLNIDLDLHNVSILSVDGIDFEVYVQVLSKMEIPWVARTDNDVSKVPHSNPPRWRFAGLNRALKLAGAAVLPDSDALNTPQAIAPLLAEHAPALAAAGIYISQIDLENDIAAVCADAMTDFAETDDIGEAVAYLQKRKAIHMSLLLISHGEVLQGLGDNPIAGPLHHALKLAKERRALAAQ